jgi:hypothetical protein
MRYVFLIYEPPANFAARQEGEDSPYVSAWRTYYQAMLEAGVYQSGAPLQEAGTATTVRSRSGQRHVQDGPFAEAKEQLGGFMLLELPSLDAALQWAARCPAASSGAVEVRPMDPATHSMIVEP